MGSGIYEVLGKDEMSKCKLCGREPKRSISQNDISHVWYEQISAELKEDTVLGVKCYCKLHHGVPILRAENAVFKAAYDNAIKGLSYEQKLKCMEILPVTSLMTKAQKSEYLEKVRDDFIGRVKLEFPNE